MRTDELVRMLATGAEAPPPLGFGQRYALALGWGAFAATLLMALALGVRPDLAEAARLPMFWTKTSRGFDGSDRSTITRCATGVSMDRNAYRVPFTRATSAVWTPLLVLGVW